MTNTPAASALASKLSELGYLELFLRSDNSAVNQIWSQPNAAANLAALVADNASPTLARFLAAEILFTKDKSYPPDSAKPALAQVYAAALAENDTGLANPWGLPGSLDSVGQHFVSLGDAAVPSLTALLDNDTPVMYGGSQEAMLGNSYEYRVKDLAAFFLSKIKNVPYTVKKTPAERDTEIASLKTKLS